MALSAVKKEPAGAPAPAEAAAPAKPAGSKAKLVKMAIGVLAVIAIGGGAYWYYSHMDHGASKPHEAKPQPAKPPVFVALEPFTVNLQADDNPQFLQVGLSLKVSDAAVVESLKLFMPEVRDRILRLLSSRKAAELLTLEGKQKLSDDIVATINSILAPPPSATAGEAEKPAPAGEAEKAAPAAEAEKAAPPEEGDKPAAEAAPAGEEKTTAQGEEKPAPPVLSALFTSFIVQ
jgi:flagellar protein FliL